MTMDNNELEDFMAKLDMSVFDKGRWDYTGEAGMLIIDYNTDATDAVGDFMEASQQPMVKSIDVYDLSEYLMLPYDDVMLIVAFIVSKWIQDGKNVIIAVDKDCNTEETNFIESLNTIAAQYKVSPSQIEVIV